MQEIRSVRRALSILEVLFKETEPLSLSELHRKLQLSKTTVARLLNTLENLGYVERDSNSQKYSLGMKLLYLGSAVNRRLKIKKMAEPVLKKIHNECEETVFLNILYQDKRLCVECLQSTKDVRVIAYIGQDAPLYCGASGRAILAYFNEEELERYLAKTKLKKIGPNTIIDKNVLIKELKRVRECGYAISVGEQIAGGLSVSAPVKNKNGKVVASLSIVTPDNRTQEDIEHYIKLLKEGAYELQFDESISEIN